VAGAARTRRRARGRTCSRTHAGGSYLSDGWNRIDFVVVVLGWLPFLFPALANLSAIRALRALRPLRTISVLPGVRRQATTLIDSLPKMADVMVLFAFCLILYSVLGVQLFKGSLRYRCYDSRALAAANYTQDVHTLSTALVAPPIAPIDADAVCTIHAQRSPLLAFFDGTATCGVPGDGVECRYYGVNPQFGSNSFDNVGCVPAPIRGHRRA
jgi:hypothetical protein